MVLFSKFAPLRAVTSRLLRENVMPARNGSGAAKMELTHGRWENQIVKDFMHFYFFLTALPYGLIIVYHNIVYGDAELQEIPEGYEPKEYEYYKNPVKRMMAKYVSPPYQMVHERNLAVIDRDHRIFKFRQMDFKVRTLMSQRGDYKGWYYHPTHERRVMVQRELVDDQHRKGF